jgi:hypothetical protein
MMMVLHEQTKKMLWFEFSNNPDRQEWQAQPMEDINYDPHLLFGTAEHDTDIESLISGQSWMD